MKKLQFIFSALASLSLVLLMTACPGSVEPGTKGDKGDKGDTGAQGPQGVAGQTGAQGPTGTANVIYSDWYGPTFNGGTAWVGTTIGSRLVNSFAKTAGAVTNNILNQGVVLVYARLGSYGTTYGLGGNATVLLPITGTATRSGVVQTESWYAEAVTGRIDINFQNSANFWSASGMSTAYRFRYVVIPGSVAGGRKAAIDYSNYEEVKKAYNLTD